MENQFNQEDVQRFSAAARLPLDHPDRDFFWCNGFMNGFKGLISYTSSFEFDNDGKLLLDCKYWIFPQEDFILCGCLYHEGYYTPELDIPIDFSFAKFYGNVSFDGLVSSRRIEFVSAEFIGNVSFCNTEFREDLGFKHTIFRKEVIFKGSKFLQSFGFLNVMHEGYMQFEHCVFSRDLQLCYMSGNGLLKLRTCEFPERRKVFFEHHKQESPEVVFSNNYFSDKQVILRNCEMHKFKVEFGNYDGFIFENCRWLEKKTDLFRWMKIRGIAEPSPDDKLFQARSHKELYSSLKQSALASGDHQLASEFGFWQLHYAQEEEWNPARFFYFWTSAYGQSWWLPLFWLLVTIGVFGLSYRCMLGFPWSDPNPWILSLGASTILFGPFELIEKLYKNDSNLLNKWINVLFIIAFFFQKGLSIYFFYESGQAIRRKVIT